MSEESITPEGIIFPRFEFRSFGQHFEQAAHRMSRLSMPVPEHLWERSSDEIYIVSRNQEVYNTKIRDEKMDIKSLVHTIDGLEQWKPWLKTEFPISAEWITEALLPIFKISTFLPSENTYDYPKFIDWLNNQPEIQAVHLHKRRFAYLVDQVICETGEVLINGAKVQTISCESTDAHEVINTIKNLGLSGVENINYVQAIKRVIGMIHKPLAN
jgi:hypothetical protein